MKKTIILHTLLLICLNLSAQFQLDVDGDTRILGKLHLAQDENLIIGVGAGASQAANTTFGFPIRNTFIGGFSGHQTTTGQQNIGIGHSSLFSNTTGVQNVALGQNALYSITTSNANTAVGDHALFLSTGSGNTAIGTQAMGDNRTGESNVAVGLNALFGNQTGNSNVAVGIAALGNGLKGNFNSAFGEAALVQDSTGSQNVGIGYSAGFNNFRGDRNVFIGGEADMTGADFENSIAIGHAAKTTASNSAVIGNAAIGSIGGYTNWSNLSDGRFKKEVNEEVYGLDFILQLRPINYKLDAVKLDNFLNPPKQSKSRFQEHLPTDKTKHIAALKQKSAKIQTGFIAQEVEVAAKKSKFQFSGIVKPLNDKGHYSLRYAEFVVPLVKAVQEQQTIIETIKSNNKDQKEQIDDLENRLQEQQREIEALKELMNKMIVDKKSTSTTTIYELSSATLAQNHPNPFNQYTSISYFIPNLVNNAVIQITNNSGQVIETLPIKQKGEGQVTLSTKALQNGTYHYSLILDGKISHTKKMLLSK